MSIWILILSASLSWAVVKDPIYDELEGLDLVEALIRDGRLEQAASELKVQSPSDRYWIVHGQLQMASTKWAKAIEYYSKAVRSARRQLYLARVRYQLKEWELCARLFNESEKLWLDNETDVIAKASCEFNAENRREAWQTLNVGRAKIHSFALVREQVSLGLEMAMVRNALETAFAAQKNLSVSELLALAELFHNKRAEDESLMMIDLARAREPFDTEVNLSAAQVHFQQGRLLSTVEAFERAALTQKRYSYHVAEIRRQLGHYRQAAYHAQLIPDAKERLKARLALYVDTNNYSMIASMESVLSRSELRDDDETRYALAYSLLRQGNLEAPIAHLNRIRRPELLAKAALLKKAVLDCRANAGGCRL